MQVALVQLRVSDDPAANLPATLDLVRQAADAGAGFVLTPECTNLLSANRDHQRAVLHDEASDPTLAALSALARDRGIWLLVGSLGLLSGDPDGRFANRSLLVAPDGSVAARYDKIHMFDVDVTPEERFRESAAYRPGDRAVIAATPFGSVGLSVCYDVRFPQLYRALAQAGADILTVPAAFNHITGAAHWEVLLRARAIETGAYVLAPAQCGFHPEALGRGRRTHGHSLAVSPWGEVIADGGTEPGVTLVTLDLAEVAEARRRLPSLCHDRAYEAPR
jgi:deaminated glutathione amidase